MTPKLLLVVEDTFLVTGRALIVVPFLTEDFFRDKTIKNGQPISVQLFCPDGTRDEMQAALWWEHFNPLGYRLMCAFPRATKEQVPIGTEVWLLEEW